MSLLTSADAGHVKAQAVMLVTASAELGEHEFGALAGRVYWELISPADHMVSAARHALLFATLAQMAGIGYAQWHECAPEAAAAWLASVIEENIRMQAG